jgi:type IV pilus assembly protein PilA
MKTQTGFSLIELLIVVVIIGIIAAIAVPNLLSARRSANEGVTVSTLRTIHGAQNTYASSYGNSNYAGTAGGVDGTALVQLGAVKLIDSALATGTRSGYDYSSGTTVRLSNVPATFCTRAIPTVNIGIAQTGSRCFGIATDGVLMTNAGADPANCGCSIGGGGEFVDRSSPF